MNVGEPSNRQPTWLAAKKRKVNSVVRHLLTSSHVGSHENQQQLDHDPNGEWNVLRLF